MTTSSSGTAKATCSGDVGGLIGEEHEHVYLRRQLTQGLHRGLLGVEHLMVGAHGEREALAGDAGDADTQAVATQGSPNVLALALPGAVTMFAETAQSGTASRLMRPGRS
jgi:hypothetical protein